jgi:phenylalanyl-tRNA synthetase beta chain
MGREADLIEEIARIYGYDNIPVEPLRGAGSASAIVESETPQTLLKQRLIARGFNEAITFSFVSPEQQRLIDPEIEPIALQNPYFQRFGGDADVPDPGTSERGGP